MKILPLTLPEPRQRELTELTQGKAAPCMVNEESQQPRERRLSPPPRPPSCPTDEEGAWLSIDRDSTSHPARRSNVLSNRVATINGEHSPRASYVAYICLSKYGLQYVRFYFGKRRVSGLMRIPMKWVNLLLSLSVSLVLSFT